MGADAIVELEHVHVARGSSVVLHDVSLRIGAGESLAILGPNGCGKSTLLKTMTCECYPIATSPLGDQTRVRMFGRERWDLTELKRRLGVVSPELPGKPTLRTTGFDAVVTGFFSSSTLWPNLTVTAAMRERAEEVLELVGATGFRDRLVGEMSAGQQRRVMIGRALAGATSFGEREMLLLDEPSNALDLGAQHDLRLMLRALAQKGVTVMMITHHIADILPEMQRVVMMREGRIVADGKKSDLLTAERLSGLFGREIEVSERGGWWRAW
jgi:iron complex transport system ATP-binding protein